MIDVMGQLKILSETELREDKEGGHVHVIADVHGSRTMLRRALQYIEDFPLAKNDKIVIMGNFIGENGNTKDVIALLRNYEVLRREQLVVLKGQTEHELILTKKKFLATKQGLKIINHYRSHPNAAGPLINEIKMDQLYSDTQWLADRPAFHISHHHIFVHSGLAPSVALSKQDTQTCVYIQNPFHNYQGIFYKRDVLGSNVPLKVVHSNTKERFQSGMPKYFMNRTDVGTLVNPGKETAVMTVGDYGKNFTKKPEVNRIWIEPR